MSQAIKAIYIDTGNTIRTVVKDKPFQDHAQQKIVELVGVREAPDAFCRKLDERYEVYKKKAKETRIQATEKDLWTHWLLEEFPADKIEPLAGKLTRLWLDQSGRRLIRPDVKKTVAELNKRGYLLGIIANSVSETEIPDWLKAEGLSEYFKEIVLSSLFGQRKPDPEIFAEAARRMNVSPAQCAYVGDNPSRDISGAREAGFGKVIILLEGATLSKEAPTGRFRPDGFIRECFDLLNFFPPRS
jgi:putative hydrolase of the HAD superfamily